MNPLAWSDRDDLYPESDGQPMAKNTDQFDWIVKSQGDARRKIGAYRVSFAHPQSLFPAFPILNRVDADAD